MNYLRHLRLIRSFTTSKSVQSTATKSCQQPLISRKHEFQLSKPVFDEKFLLDENNLEKINENIKLRKGVGDIYLVHEINKQLKEASLSENERFKLENKLQEELKKIPNSTHPDVMMYGEDPKDVRFFNDKPTFKHQPLEFSEICKKINILRTDHLSNFSGHKSYYLMGDLAAMVSYVCIYIKFTLQLKFHPGTRSHSIHNI